MKDGGWSIYENAGKNSVEVGRSGERNESRTHLVRFERGRVILSASLKGEGIGEELKEKKCLFRKIDVSMVKDR